MGSTCASPRETLERAPGIIERAMAEVHVIGEIVKGDVEGVNIGGG